MTGRAAAARYARALMEVAVAERVDLEQIERELAGFVGLFEQHPALGKVMLNPAVPAPRKRAAMIELVARARVSPLAGKLLALLAGRDRLALLGGILAAYRERLLDRQQVVRAELTLAASLPPDRAQAIERALARLTGRTVRLGTRIDPAIIGGVVTRIGDTIYDGSVTTRLARMRKALETAG
ncbi:MAG: ATP synthase F1 subunit delta [Acidobacteria bacterium]|nr:ATP synthase F1 subunit delta [Acidobacteriota bacterium]